MKRTILGIIVCLFATTVFAVMCPAQIEEMAIGNTFGVGARAMGMGGASLGLADDFTALYWNPAGMAQIQKFEFFTSFSHNTAITDTYYGGDDEIGTSRSRVRPNSLGFVYPFQAQQGGLAIGFGYNRPQNFDFQTKIHGIDNSVNTEFSGHLVNETNINSGGIGIWSFGASVYITKTLLIGGSVDFWSGQSLNQLDLTATNVSNTHNALSSFRYDDEYDREYSGIGGRVGILANLTDAISLGVTMVAPTELTVEEIWHQYNLDTYNDGTQDSNPADGVISYDIERPFEVGTGVAVKLLHNQVVLAADVHYTDWRQTRYDPEPAENIESDHFDQYYDATVQARLGAEFRIPVIETHLRLGYFRDAIPFTDTEVENERDFLTVGVGKIFEDSIKFDVAYMWGNWQHHRNELTTKRNTHRIFASGAYLF